MPRHPSPAGPYCCAAVLAICAAAGSRHPLGGIPRVCEHGV